MLFYLFIYLFLLETIVEKREKNSDTNFVVHQRVIASPRISLVLYTTFHFSITNLIPRSDQKTPFFLAFFPAFFLHHHQQPRRRPPPACK